MDFKLELVLIPVSGRRPREAVLRGEVRLQGRRRPPAERRVPRRPADAARLGLLAHVRDRDHRGGARLLPRHAPRRHRHRGRAGRARRPRRRGERDPAHDAGRAGSPARTPGMPTTTRSPTSAIPTATRGCCRSRTASRADRLTSAREPRRRSGRASGRSPTFVAVIRPSRNGSASEPSTLCRV